MRDFTKTEMGDQTFWVIEPTDRGLYRMIRFVCDEGFRLVDDIWESDLRQIAIITGRDMDARGGDFRTDLRLPFNVDPGRATTNRGFMKKVAECPAR